MATKKGIKAETPIETETETVEVAGLDIETTSATETVKAQKTPNVLLHRFTSEDLYNRNPELYERLYKTFDPMGIGANRDELHDLIDRYLDWYPAKQAEVDATNQKKRLEAEEKIKKLAAQMGLEVTVN